MTFLPGAALGCALIACALPAASPPEAAPPREAAHREPAWKHPQRYPRPSPDRVYAPPAPRPAGQ